VDALALSAADSAAALQQGGAIATVVAQGLAQRLQAELKHAGATGAVDFCAQNALMLTDSLLRDQPAGVQVKRTSARIRNPRNRADSAEAVAIAWFDSMRIAAGQLPGAYLQVVSGQEVRFYRPLIVAPFCTECHGPRDSSPHGVRRILQKRYPNDQATGYHAGDLRGVIRVSLPRKELGR
jgi:hypothetical protein